MNNKFSTLPFALCAIFVASSSVYADVSNRVVKPSFVGAVNEMKQHDLARNQKEDTDQRRKPIEIKILHTNDHHSYLDGQRFSLNLDYDLIQPGTEAVQVDLGGFGRIANEISQLRDDETLVLNSGELNGTLYFSLFKGEVDFKVFNAVGLDAYALGNHEFDEGEGRLAELIQMANFPIVSANVHPTSASPLYGANIHPYIIKEIDGQRVAVVGVLKVEKTVESSLVTDAVEFSNEIETVRKTVAELEFQGINKIIVLSHVGYDFDQKLAAEVVGIDAIIGGDSHTLLDSTGELNSMGLAVKGEYPTVINNPNGQPVYIAQAWQYARGLGVLELSFDKFGQVIEAEGNIELLVGGPYKIREAGLWQPATIEQTNSISAAINKLETVKEIAPSALVESIIEPYKAELEVFRLQDIGSVSTFMPFNRIPSSFAAGEIPTGSYAAHIVADAFLKYLPKADVAIQNSGGVRTAFNQGVFTVADAYTMLPFSNTLVTIKMSGQDIVNVLEEATAYALGSGSTGAFPYASHLRYEVVKSAATGSRIRNVDVKDRVTGIWSAINYAFEYTVATNSFTGLGKDGYKTFAAVRAANPAAFTETDVVYVVPLIEYFTQELSGQVLPSLKIDDYCLLSVSD